MRKNIQHLSLPSKTAETPVDATNHFTTAEGITVKSSYTETDIEGLDHLDFGAGFAPNLRGPYATCMCDALGRFGSMQDFQQPKKVMPFTAEI